MHLNQIDKKFYQSPSFKEPFLNSIPNAVHNEKNVYLPGETFNAIEALPEVEKKTVYNNFLTWIKNYSTANAETLKSIYKDQSKYYNEKTCNDMLSYMKRHMHDVEMPFEKFTHIRDEEKARRKAVQKKAFDVYLDRANEDLGGFFFTSAFTDNISRPTQRVFCPERLTEDSYGKAVENVRLLKRVKEASLLHKNGEPFTEQELKDRKDLAKMFEDKITAALKGVFEANACESDEEFLEKASDLIYSSQLLVQTGRSELGEILGDMGLTENDLSSDFIDYFKENAPLAYGAGSLLQSRFSVIANPMYPEVEPKEWDEFYNNILDYAAGKHGDIRESFHDTFSKPGIDIPPKEEQGEVNFMVGYSTATGFSLAEKYVGDGGIAILKSYAQKYLGVDDYKECNVVDENGILIQEEEIFKNKIVKGEPVNLLLKDARYMVPIKISKWGAPVPTEVVHSPFNQMIKDSTKAFMKMNEKLPGNLKLKFGDDIWKSDEEKLGETFKKNYSDPEKVRLHIRARVFAKEEGVQGSSNKTTKNNIIKDGFLTKETDRLEQKFGKIQEKDAYFRRTFPYFLKTDGSKNSQEYNEMLYKSYLRGTEEAKTIFVEGIKKALSLNFKEINEALKSDETALDFYEKHYSELKIANDMHDLANNSNILTPGFKEYALKNARKIQSFADTLQARVILMSEPAYMADVYDQPVYNSNGKYNEYLFNYVSNGKTAERDMNGNVIGVSEYNTLLYKGNLPIQENEINQLAKEAPTLNYDMKKEIANIPKGAYWRAEEYRRLFQKEIREIGINGEKYSSISDFIDKNEGNIFNVIFKKDSEQYKNIVKAVDTFMGKLAGKKEAFPPDRQNRPIINKDDFIEFKELFDKYIDAKNEKLKSDKKDAFKKDSTSDKRYQFAKKMSEILGKTVQYERLDLVKKSQNKMNHKITGKIVNNTANNGKGYVVNEEAFEYLHNGNKIKNIVNEESNYFINGEILENETALLQNLLDNDSNKDKVNQKSEKTNVENAKTKEAKDEKIINNDSKSI